MLLSFTYPIVMPDGHYIIKSRRVSVPAFPCPNDDPDVCTFDTNLQKSGCNSSSSDGANEQTWASKRRVAAARWASAVLLAARLSTEVAEAALRMVMAMPLTRFEGLWGRSLDVNRETVTRASPGTITALRTTSCIRVALAAARIAVKFWEDGADSSHFMNTDPPGDQSYPVGPIADVSRFLTSRHGARFDWECEVLDAIQWKVWPFFRQEPVAISAVPATMTATTLEPTPTITTTMTTITTLPLPSPTIPTTKTTTFVSAATRSSIPVTSAVLPTKTSSIMVAAPTMADQKEPLVAAFKKATTAESTIRVVSRHSSGPILQITPLTAKTTVTTTALSSLSSSLATSAPFVIPPKNLVLPPHLSPPPSLLPSSPSASSLPQSWQPPTLVAPICQSFDDSRGYGANWRINYARKLANEYRLERTGLGRAESIPQYTMTNNNNNNDPHVSIPYRHPAYPTVHDPFSIAPMQPPNQNEWIAAIDPSAWPKSATAESDLVGLESSQSSRQSLLPVQVSSTKSANDFGAQNEFGSLNNNNLASRPRSRFHRFVKSAGPPLHQHRGHASANHAYDSEDACDFKRDDDGDDRGGIENHEDEWDDYNNDSGGNHDDINNSGANDDDNDDYDHDEQDYRSASKNQREPPDSTKGTAAVDRPATAERSADRSYSGDNDTVSVDDDDFANDAGGHISRSNRAGAQERNRFGARNTPANLAPVGSATTSRSVFMQIGLDRQKKRRDKPPSTPLVTEKRRSYPITAYDTPPRPRRDHELPKRRSSLQVLSEMWKESTSSSASTRKTAMVPRDRGASINSNSKDPGKRKPKSAVENKKKINDGGTTTITVMTTTKSAAKATSTGDNDLRRSNKRGDKIDGNTDTSDSDGAKRNIQKKERHRALQKKIHQKTTTTTPLSVSSSSSSSSRTSPLSVSSSSLPLSSSLLMKKRSPTASLSPFPSPTMAPTSNTKAISKTMESGSSSNTSNSGSGSSSSSNNNSARLIDACVIKDFIPQRSLVALNASRAVSRACNAVSPGDTKFAASEACKKRVPAALMPKRRGSAVIAATTRAVYYPKNGVRLVIASRA